MFEDFHIFCVGVAVVVDTALLLTLLDRRNWPHLAIPIAMLALGGWLFHAGTFVHLMLTGATIGWSPALQWVAAMAMAAGLAIMPSALLHGVLRVWQTGFARLESGRWRHAMLYLPIVVLIPAGQLLWDDPGSDFMSNLAPLVAPFTWWCLAVNLGSAAALLRMRRRFEQPEFRRFFKWTSTVLLLVTALLFLVFAIDSRIWPGGGKLMLLALTMAPLLPAVVFAFFVIRYNFMRLMIEQTLVYGAIIVGLLLFHRLIVGDMSDALTRRFGIDFGMLIGVMAIVLVIAYRPLRERASEALRYLMGSRVADVRQRTRELTVEMSRHAEDEPERLLQWFVDSLAQSLQVPFAAGWVFRPDHAPMFASSPLPSPPQQGEGIAGGLLEQLKKNHQTAASRLTAPNSAVVDALKTHSAGLAVRLADEDQPALFLFGQRSFASGMGDEEINAVVLLVEQFGVTLQNAALRQKALAAERRILENEKLTTLGLLASCLAHEVKNPLSSIKTIATVVAEQLGNDHEHAEDLAILLAEVERLSGSTSELLGIARPAERGKPCKSLPDVLAASVRFLGHEAKQQSVEVRANIDQDVPPLAADENAIREILINLLGNSIDAAGTGGVVEVTCRRNGQFAVADFSDNGPGIAAEVQDRLFEPFATTKENGTGLGLYIVDCRVREMGGEILCESAAGQGTTFTVKLPLEEPAQP
jgi:signal transduction histidine kinase